MRWLVPGMMWLAILTWLMWLVTSVAAHDATHPLGGWFNGLRSKNGNACCSNSDGETVAEVDWKSAAGRYQVFLDGKWLTVPPDAVVEGPNLDGRTIVWPVRGPLDTTIRCFMPGAMT